MPHAARRKLVRLADTFTLLHEEIAVAHNVEFSSLGTNRLLYSVREACETLRISERSLWSLTAPRGPIPVVRIGRSVRYDPRDLEIWVAERKTGGRD